MSRLTPLCLLLPTLAAFAQKIPDVRCQVEDYNVDAVISWQSPKKVGKIQVVVLRDPAGEQEARFDLMHGATLISLRHGGKELLYGQGAGASVALFAPRPGEEQDLKGLSPYWSAYSPTQGGASMDVPATVAGAACHGPQSMRAFAMMVDRGVDNSFQKEPLLGVWKGRVSNGLPPGYSTPYAIETRAGWVENPGRSPRYYLKLEQNVVNVRPGGPAPLEWYLEGASPWDFEYKASYPEQCTEKSPCSSETARVLMHGRYEDEARTVGFATVAPTGGWKTKRAYIRENAEFVVLVYGAVWAAPRHTFATVLGRDLEGVGAFGFNWYVCAGSWEQARAFAQKQ